MDSKILPNYADTIYQTHFIKKRNLPFLFRPGMVIGTEHMCIPNLHKNVELLFFTEGRGQFTCGNDKYDVSPGDLTVANSYLVHNITSPDTVRYYCLIVNNDFCASCGAHVAELLFEPFVRTEEAQRLFTRVAQAFQQPEPLQELQIHTAVLELLLYLCRSHSTPKPENPQLDNSLRSIWLALDFMKQNLGKKLTVEQIAASAGFSKFYFLRLFKRLTGYTVTQYLTLLRCDRARQLLQSGSCNVTEAAEVCGFDNASYFTKVFKSHTGRNPSELLKEK